MSFSYKVRHPMISAKGMSTAREQYDYTECLFYRVYEGGSCYDMSGRILAFYAIKIL